MNSKLKRKCTKGSRKTETQKLYSIKKKQNKATKITRKVLQRIVDILGET